MTVKIRVLDWDRFSADDVLHSDDSFQLGPALLNVGPNTFGINALIPHSKLREEWYEGRNYAELYFRLRAEGSGVSTSWANSPNEDVRIR
jgi:hypothetical protein